MADILSVQQLCEQAMYVAKARSLEVGMTYAVIPGPGEYLDWQEVSDFEFSGDDKITVEHTEDSSIAKRPLERDTLVVIVQQ